MQGRAGLIGVALGGGVGGPACSMARERYWGGDMMEVWGLE